MRRTRSRPCGTCRIRCGACSSTRNRFSRSRASAFFRTSFPWRHSGAARRVRAFAVAMSALCALASAASAQDSLRIRAPGPTSPSRSSSRRWGTATSSATRSTTRASFATRCSTPPSWCSTPNATVASTVHGDVVVINGDLFLQPGAKIDGRAVAIGGGVYDSQQASVGGEKLSFRDVHFDTVRTSSGIDLVYRVPPPPEDTDPDDRASGPLRPADAAVRSRGRPLRAVGTSHHARTKALARDRSDHHLSLEPRRLRSRCHAQRGAGQRLYGDGVRRTHDAVERSMDSIRSRELDLDARRRKRLSELLALDALRGDASPTNGSSPRAISRSMAARAPRMTGRCAAAVRGACSTETTRCT